MYYWDGTTFYSHDDTVAKCETRVSLDTAASPSLTVTVTAGTSLLVYAAVGDEVVHSNLPAGTLITAIAGDYKSCTVDNTASGAGTDANARVIHNTKLHQLADATHDGFHSKEEFRSLWPRVAGYKSEPIAPAQDIDGNLTAEPCYILNDPIINGGKTGVDTQVQTTWKDSNQRLAGDPAHVGYTLMGVGTKTFANRLNMTTSLAKIILGDKVGDGSRMSGINGVRLIFQNNLNHQCDWEMYGGCLVAGGTLKTIAIANNVANSVQVYAGVQMEASRFLAIASSLVGEVYGWNCHLISRLSGAVYVQSLNFNDSDGIIVTAPGSPTYAMQTAALFKSVRGVTFCSNQTDADMRIFGAGVNWYFVKSRKSTAPFLFKLDVGPIDTESSSAHRQAVIFHPRVMDEDGEPLENVPVSIESDGIDYLTGTELIPFASPVYTDAAGDITYNMQHLTTGVTVNGLVLASFGSDASLNTVVAHRKITLKINNPDHPGYISDLPSRGITFTGPGRDQLQGVLSPNAGDYAPELYMPIMLPCKKGLFANFEEVEADA